MAEAKVVKKINAPADAVWAQLSNFPQHQSGRADRIDQLRG